MNRPFAHLCELPEYGGHTDVESSGVYADKGWDERYCCRCGQLAWIRVLTEHGFRWRKP